MPQNADEKPVGLGCAWRHQNAFRRQPRRFAEHEGAFAERARDLRRRLHRKFRMAGEECPHLRAVLLVEHRTGDIGDAPAGFEQRHRTVENVGLLLLPLLECAGARNVQVRTPKSIGGELADLAGRADLVLIDAPCTGTGAWRRNPDAKWRVRPGALEQRCKEQVEILDSAVPLVKPGGRIAYITCSVLEEENGAQVRAFLGRHAEFSVAKPADTAKALGERAYMFLKAALIGDEGLLMTPRRTDTDGFFVSILRRG